MVVAGSKLAETEFMFMFKLTFVKNRTKENTIEGKMFRKFSTYMRYI